MMMYKYLDREGGFVFILLLRKNPGGYSTRYAEEEGGLSELKLLVTTTINRLPFIVVV